ncbi:MAG TPA: hypothetical protein VFJ82_15830 [Longimicrobium sp.]|nr:hypothetical protein [Longimicrobium sp.]
MMRETDPVKILISPETKSSRYADVSAQIVLLGASNMDAGEIAGPWTVLDHERCRAAHPRALDEETMR